MLGHVGLGEVERVADVGDRLLLVAEGVEDEQTLGVGEALADLGVEVGELPLEVEHGGQSGTWRRDVRAGTPGDPSEGTA